MTSVLFYNMKNLIESSTLHEGNAIKAILAKQNMSIAEAARRMKMSRQNLHQNLKSELLSRELLKSLESIGISLDDATTKNNPESQEIKNSFINKELSNSYKNNNLKEKEIGVEILAEEVKSALTLFSRPEIISMLGVLPNPTNDNHWMTFAEAANGAIELLPPISSLIKDSLLKGEPMILDPKKLFRIPDTRAINMIVAYENNNSPFIEKSDKICIKIVAHGEVKFGQYYYVKFRNGDSAIHIIKKHSDKQYWILSNLNKHFDDDEILITDIDEVHRVHYVLKKAAQD